MEKSDKICILKYFFKDLKYASVVKQWNTFYAMRGRCDVSGWASLPYRNVKLSFHVY